MSSKLHLFRNILPFTTLEHPHRHSRRCPIFGYSDRWLHPSPSTHSPLIHPNKSPFIWVYRATYNGFTKAIGRGYKNHIFEATLRVKGKPEKQFFSMKIWGNSWNWMFFLVVLLRFFPYFFCWKDWFFCSISLQVKIRSLYLRLGLCTSHFGHLVYWGKIQDSYISYIFGLGKPQKSNLPLLVGIGSGERVTAKTRGQKKTLERSASPIVNHNQDLIKGSLVEKLPSYGDLKMQRVQYSNSSSSSAK